MKRPPDLVVFDVDGTLHDAFAWWSPVIRRGVAEFASRTGIAIDPPDDAFAESVIGMKDNGVWDPFLPAGEKHRWRELRAHVLPMELDELRSGRDYLFAGVRPLLAHLRALGVPVALASNCRADYMAAICEGQGLGAITDWQFCLDSEGIATKTDMLRRAVQAARARAPVMVGDREPDQVAAREAGMPFVWRVNSRCKLSGVDLRWSGDPAELLAGLDLPGISGPDHVG